MPRNREAIQAIVAALEIPAQLGGGIRDLETIEAWLEHGVRRVILGTVAKEDPLLVAEACRHFEDQIVVGIDAKDGKVAVRGWAEVTEMRAIDLVREFENVGVAAIVYTDISRDGMMQGVNVEATAQLAEEGGIPVIASGGVTNMDDLKRLAAVADKGILGAITGRAIYEGTLDVSEAQAYCDSLNS